MRVSASTFPAFAHPLIPSTPMRRREDTVLAQLIDGYSVHGGLASTEEVVGLMRPHWRQPISILAKWIIDRKVVSFSWRTQILLPMFQFARPRIAPHPGVSEAAHEIADLLDVEAFASWFIRPSEALQHVAPADIVAGDPEAVATAARATRLSLLAHRHAA